MRRILLSLLILALTLSAVLVLGQANVNATPEVQATAEVTAQTEASTAILNITVNHSTCGLVVSGNVAVTPEATSEAVSAASNVSATLKAPLYPLLALGDGCANVIAGLHVASNDTIWIKFFVSEDEAPWQQFETVPGDAHSPRFDKRGRFVGCGIPQLGEQTCRFLWTYQGTTYLIAVPVEVGSAYIAPVVPINPAQPAFSTPAAIPVSTPNNSGIWGSCGSCTTCGGPVEQCVQAPDNTCVWDAARCEHRRPGDN